MEETVSQPETTSSEPAAAFRDEVGQPIVLKLKKKKKRKGRKARYSMGWRDVQEFDGHLSRAARRVARATSRGLDHYEKARKKSARGKRDGAMRDYVPNAAEALSESLSVASKLPSDVADMFNTRSSRRWLRRSRRLTSDAMRVWRL